MQVRNGPNRLLVHHETGKHKDVCNLGHKHTVSDYITKRIVKTEATYVQDTGYYLVELPIYTDYQGRLYKAYESFDTGRWSFRREDDTYWTKEVPTGW